MKKVNSVIAKAVAVVLWCGMAVGCVVEDGSFENQSDKFNSWEWDVGKYNVRGNSFYLSKDSDLLLAQTVNYMGGKGFRELNLSTNTVKEYSGQPNDYGYSYINKISDFNKFHNGGFITTYTDKRVSINLLRKYTVIVDSNGKVIKKGMFLYILPKPKLYEYPEQSEMAGHPDVILKFISVDFDYIEYDANWIFGLYHDDDINFIIKFNHNLKTESAWLNKSIFWVDAETIDSLFYKIPKDTLSSDVSFHDLLYKKLINMSEGR